MFRAVCVCFELEDYNQREVIARRAYVLSSTATATDMTTTQPNEVKHKKRPGEILVLK